MEGIIETAWDDVTEADMTPENFPGYKHVFFFQDHGLLTVTDSFGEVALSVAAANSLRSDGTLDIGSNPSSILSGAWVAPGTKKVLITLFCRPGSGATLNTYIGGNTNAEGGFKISSFSGAATDIIYDNVQGTVSGGRTGTGDTVKFFAKVLAVDWANPGLEGMRPFTYDGTTWTADTPVNIAANGGLGMPVITSEVQFWDNINYAMLTVAHFTVLPTDAEIKAATLWSYAKLREATPRKLICPIFMGRS